MESELTPILDEALVAPVQGLEANSLSKHPKIIFTSSKTLNSITISGESLSSPRPR
jgi:hypothetical protein